MGATSRNRGARFEREIARRLRRIWPRVRRNTTGRSQPDGDLIECGGWYVECKHTQTPRISSWLTKMEVEAGDRPRMLVFAVQRTKPPRYTYAVLPLDLLVDLMERAKEAQRWRG